jgi:rod shape-determining protein MreD
VNLPVPLKLVMVLVTAALLQAGIVSWLNVGGYVPDLLLVVAVAAGVVGGVDRGALIGFGAGLCTDLMVTTPFGLWALVGCLTGAAAGYVSGTSLVRSPTNRAMTFAVAVGAGLLAFAVLARLVGQASLGTIDLPLAVVTGAVAAGILSRIASRVLTWALGPDVVPPGRVP